MGARVIYIPARFVCKQRDDFYGLLYVRDEYCAEYVFGTDKKSIGQLRYFIENSITDYSYDFIFNIEDRIISGKLDEINNIEELNELEREIFENIIY